MLENLEIIQDTTKEAISLIIEIKADINRLLTSGIFDDTETKKANFKKIQQLIHNEESVLVQIYNIQNYLTGIIEELERLKPTSTDLKQRKHSMKNFTNSIEKAEIKFATVDDMTQIVNEEDEYGFVESIVHKIKNMFSKR